LTLYCIFRLADKVTKPLLVIKNFIPTNIISHDGTTIAFGRFGQGPTLILVDGALHYRAFDQGDVRLADQLAQHFSVFRYDRRGRGGTDTPPYDIQREIEDIEALIDAAGGQAYVFGHSSGAVLAMEATIELPGKIKQLAMYGAP
jgi:pimeloyl-ACP methyl ester carboxylesterase